MFEPRLIHNLHKFSGAHEAQMYLDFVGDLLFALGISNEDPRFHFNPTKDSRFFLPLTINNRYIICKGRNLKEASQEASWWLIHPGLHFLDDGHRYDYFTFAHKRHDLPEGGPLMRRYPLSDITARRSELFGQVLECARRDLNACKRTPQRLSHSGAAYALACDDATRAEVLGRVWPEGVEG